MISGKLSALGLDFTRIEAIDGIADEAACRAHYAPRSAGAVMRRAMNHGEIACTLSHFKAWEALRDSPTDTLLVLEDDADIGPDIKDLPAVLGQLPDDWEILLLTALGDTRPLWQRQVGAWTVGRFQRPGVGAVAYVIHRRLLRHRAAWSGPVRFSIDLWRFWYWWHGMAIYSMRPQMVAHEAGSISVVDTVEERDSRRHRPRLIDRLAAVGVRAIIYPLAAWRRRTTLRYLARQS